MKTKEKESSHIGGGIPTKPGTEDVSTERLIKINKLGLSKKDEIFD
jgi:hypothetical protein